jgi:hypothetical protein
MRDGFRLELPNGAAFEASVNITSQIAQEPVYLFEGGRNATALFGEASNSDQSGAVYAGTGATIRTFEIQFAQYEGSTDEWGPLDTAQEHAMETYRDVFDDALEQVQITSQDPATLEQGEYSASGRLHPVTVVVLNSELTVDYTQETSLMTGTLRLGDAADLREVETAAGMPG